jgi:hypothetical protein
MPGYRQKDIETKKGKAISNEKKIFSVAVEKSSSAVLRCKLHRSTYIYTCDL